MKIRKGDKVLVIKGKDRGKSGVIVAADHTTHQVKVEGVNIAKRHQRRGGSNRQPGGVVEVIAPLPSANVMLVCSQCNRPTRTGYQLAGDTKHRICRQCKAIVDHVKK